MKRAIAVVALACALVIPAIAMAQFKPPAGTATSGDLAPSSVATPFVDGGQVNVGGRAGNYWSTGDLCLGTSNGTPSCTSGPELIWVPNTAYFGNATAGVGLRISSTGVATNNGGGITAGTFLNMLASTGTNAKTQQCGASSMTTGELAVTFSSAFSVAPVCICTHVNTTNTNACTIKSASVPTTTAVTFAVASGGTDVVDWCCTGDR